MNEEQKIQEPTDSYANQTRYKASKSWACSNQHTPLESRVSLRQSSINSSTLSLFGFDGDRSMTQVSQPQVVTYRQRIPRAQELHPLHGTFQAVESFPVLRVCFIVFVVVVAYLIRGDYLARRQAKRHDLLMAIQKCRTEYAINRCDTPTESLEQKCFQWEKCSKKDPNHDIPSSEILMEVTGRVVKVFFQSLGVAGILGVIIYLLVNRPNKDVGLNKKRI